MIDKCLASINADKDKLNTFLDTYYFNNKILLINNYYFFYLHS